MEKTNKGSSCSEASRRSGLLRITSVLPQSPPPIPIWQLEQPEFLLIRDSFLGDAGTNAMATWRFGPVGWQHEQKEPQIACLCNNAGQRRVRQMLLWDITLFLDIILAIRACIQPFALPGAGLQMHWKTMGAMRLRKTTIMMMQWTANCSTPPEGRR